MSDAIAIVGWKNSGKTTLVCRLVEALSARGHRVATLKHAHHAATMDVPGTDSARHRAAGATATMLLTDAGWSMSSAEPLGLDAALARLPAHDVAIVEGFKGSALRKIECRRAGADGPPLWPQDERIIAIAHDGCVTDTKRPTFDLDAIDAIADFIEAQTGTRP